MACHAARVLRQRHKAEADMLESEISPEQRKCLESAFEAADKNGDGILSADEYYEIFQTHGLSIGKQNKNFFVSKGEKSLGQTALAGIFERVVFPCEKMYYLDPSNSLGLCEYLLVISCYTLASQIQIAKLQLWLCSAFGFLSSLCSPKKSETSLVVFQGPDNLKCFEKSNQLCSLELKRMRIFNITDEGGKGTVRSEES